MNGQSLDRSLESHTVITDECANLFIYSAVHNRERRITRIGVSKNNWGIYKCDYDQPILIKSFLIKNKFLDKKGVKSAILYELGEIFYYDNDGFDSIHESAVICIITNHLMLSGCKYSDNTKDDECYLESESQDIELYQNNEDDIGLQLFKLLCGLLPFIAGNGPIFSGKLLK